MGRKKGEEPEEIREKILWQGVKMMAKKQRGSKDRDTSHSMQMENMKSQ